MYNFIHESLSLCFWDLPALLVGVLMIVMFAVYRHNQKSREKDFEKELEEKIKEITGEDTAVNA